MPGRGGCYEIWVDDDRIYSKLETGEFPDEDAIVDEIKRRVGVT